MAAKPATTRRQPAQIIDLEVKNGKLNIRTQSGIVPSPSANGSSNGRSDGASNGNGMPNGNGKKAQDAFPLPTDAKNARQRWVVEHVSIATMAGIIAGLDARGFASQVTAVLLNREKCQRLVNRLIEIKQGEATQPHPPATSSAAPRRETREVHTMLANFQQAEHSTPDLLGVLVRYPSALREINKPRPS